MGNYSIFYLLFTLIVYNKPMNRRKFISQSAITILVVGGYNESHSRSSKKVSSDMKYSAGKCGANMMDTSSALNRKKIKILNQMREDDNRRQSVLNAKNSKEIYDSIRLT